MADEKNTKMLLILGAVILVAIVVYFCMKKKSSYSKGTQENAEIEKFTALAAGANDNTGVLLDDSYDLVQGADDGIPAHHFADMVNQGDLMKEFATQPKNVGENLRSMERLQRVQGKALMPRTSTSITPFNVDVANPTAYSFRAAAPRATSALKSKYKDYSMSTFIRGDIPITYYPGVPLIAKTHQGRDDLMLSGLFTPYFNALYNKYTGKEYKNLVQHVAGAGQAAGYGGAAGGVIMDHY
jgi:hypothetical protein